MTARPFRFRATPIVLALVALVLTACAHAAPQSGPRFLYNPTTPAAPPERPQLTLADDDRILVLAPHPDDEILATGGLIQQALDKGLPSKVTFLTNGDNNEFAFLFFSKAFTLDAASAVHAGQVRGLEAMRAGRTLGLDSGDQVFLGYPDFGTMEIWQNRWGEGREAFRSMFSERNAVPYWFAQTPDAPYKGEAILADLKEVVADFKPTKIFVSHPADQNPDHAALAMYLRTALWDLGDAAEPEVYHFLTHYGDWPQPRGLMFDAPHEPPAQFDEPGRWVTLPLAAGQAEKKLDALKKHKTQYGASAPYLESYMRANELFDRIDVITLPNDAPRATISPSGSATVGDQPLAEQLATGTPRQVRVEGDEFVFSFETPQGGMKSVDLQLFGYRGDRPFEAMPKLAIKVSGDDVTVADRKQALAAGSVDAVNAGGATEVRVPLALLGDPERVHFNATLEPAGGPVDPMPWVSIILPQRNN
jgi:LmbE family N-acetylglucosaminyl deacetylase